MESLFETTDLLLAAFLEAKGHRAMDVSLNNKGMGMFIFRDSPVLQGNAKEFLENGLVRVIDLGRQLTVARRRVREARQTHAVQRREVNASQQANSIVGA